MDHVQIIKRKIIERYSSLSDDKEKFAEAIDKPLKQSFRINKIKGEYINKLNIKMANETTSMIHAKDEPVSDEKNAKN